MFYHTVFLLTDHITFFSYQLVGAPNPQWQEDFVDQIPGGFSELQCLKVAVLLQHGSEDSLVYCVVWSKTFFPA